MDSRILLSALLLVASVGGQVRAADPTEPTLLGSWEEDPGTCEGDNHVTYRADGAFFGYDYEGRWALKGAALVTTITKRMGSDENWRSVAKAERTATIIVSLSRDRLVERWPDGSLQHLHRCH